MTEIACYRPVRGVEIVLKEALNHDIVNRPEHYSPATVRSIAKLLESRLGIRPAARPGRLPEDPSRAQRMINRIGGLHPSTAALICIGISFAMTLLMTGTSALFELLSVIYDLLGR